MKHTIIFISILLLVTGFSSCASSARSQIEAAGSSVWRVTNNDNGNTIFLGGSVHILREQDFPLPREFDLAFYQSDVLVLETDVEMMADPEIAQYLLSQMFLPEGETLQSILEPETYEALVSAFLEYGIPIDGFMTMKPSMVVNVLAMLQIQTFGFVQLGVDFYYLEKAINKGMPVYYLESVQSQIDMLISMGVGYEDDFVRYSLQDMENTEATLETLLAEWKSGAGLYSSETLIEMRELWPEIYRTLITDRHDAWIPQIEAFLSSGRVYFVIAGNLHMHGPDGLLLLLEDAGFTVEQLL